MAGLSTSRPDSSMVPIAAPLAGALAVAIGATVLDPFWYAFGALVPLGLCALGLWARRKAAAYAKRFEEGNEADRPATVDPSRLKKGAEPDKLLVTGGAGLLVAAGVLATVASATVSPLIKPELPAQLQSEGQVVVGEGNPVDVKILYGINYPASAALISEEYGTLPSLVDEGKIKLTTQGVSLSEETRLAVPVRVGEACAFDQGGQQAAFDFTGRYYQAFLSGDGTDNTADLVAKAGEPLGEEFSTCTTSGKYEFAAGKALEESSKYAQQGFPQIFINGEEVQPESVTELVKLIDEAA